MRPVRGTLAFAILLVAGTCGVAALALGSAFTLPVGGAPRPAEEGLLAQRTIDRTWGPSDDSNYVEVKVPGWRDEGTALTLSALAPGTGQLYAGDRTGWLFAAGEAFAWFEWSYMRHRGRVIRNDAMSYAGDPNDSLSRWSFSTYEQRTGQSAEDLRRIYAADHALFYYLIARDDAYQTGWDDFSLGYNATARERFIEIREDSQAHFKRARYFQTVIWANHVVAALHAMRAARAHNLQFSRTLKLGLKTRWTGGGPALAAVIEARF